MQTGFYEPHSMPDEKLPFIFHRDLIRNRDTENISLANWHRNIEILYFFSGHGEVLCDTHTTPVQAGDVFVINANSLHNVVTDNEARYYCLIVDGDFCRANDIDTDTLTFQNRIRDEKAEALFVSVAENYARRHEFYKASIRSAVLALMVYLACNFTLADAAKQKRGSGKTIENIKLAMGYMQAHFSTKLTMEAVASKVGLSVYHFAREFKKVTGVTFVSYINHLRCENAKKLLQSGKYTVAEACAQSGFENASYFSKTFKSFFGQSPAAFLKKE